jgi:hypothetical protein
LSGCSYCLLYKENNETKPFTRHINSYNTNRYGEGFVLRCFSGNAMGFSGNAMGFFRNSMPF